MNNVNIESKNSLARLMATENISVQHNKVETASFDVKERVLNLPIWEDMGDVMYEGLIGHEVGHALYTPFEEWKEFITEYPKLKDYANVIEDARIEKKMKTKFPGMRKTFFGMYDELNVRDFFGTQGKDLNTYGILDRINLHFKLGVRADVKFNDEETLFVNRVSNANTFEEVLELTLELSEYAKNEELSTDFDDMNFEYDPEAEDGTEEADEGLSRAESDEDGEDADGSSSQGQNNPDETDEDGESDSNITGDRGGNSDLPPESKTQKSFDEQMGKLNDDNAKTPIYVDLPKVDAKGVTVGFKRIGKLLSDHFDKTSAYSYWDDGEQIQANINQGLSAWKKDTLPVVNYMVKEFEMKQAATAHRRTSVGKTGVLDTNKMHAYKYEEDIFKRVASVKDGRNHALSIYVDWSGSMQDKIFSTVKQTITLVMFARKVGIPFRVYAFSNAQNAKRLNEKVEGYRPKFYEPEDNGNFAGNHLMLRRLTLLEFFNEKMSAKDFNSMIDNFYKVGMANDWSSRDIQTPEGFGLASTPLNECIIGAYDQVADFKREVGKEKVNVIFLTDGEADGNDTYFDAKEARNRHGYRGWGEEQEYLVIRDPKTKKVISDSIDFRQVTAGLLKGLGIRCGVNVIGFFLTSRRQINFKIDRSMKWEEADVAKKLTTKKGYCSFSMDGYDKFFMVNDAAMDNDVEFKEIDKKEDGTVDKGKLRTAFKKFSKGRKVNKMLLNEFVAMVA